MDRTTAGIDIGGTKIRWVRMNHGRVIASGETRTPKEKLAFQKFVRMLAEDLRQKGVMRIGVSVAGVVSGNTLKKCPNLPFIKNINFGKVIPHGVTFRIDNDARCFARSEAVLGRGKERSSVLALTIGTGIGRALIVRGKVKKVKSFEYPELWEAAYQKSARDPASRLGEFLAKKIAILVKKHNTQLIVLGGGRMRTKGLFSVIQKELKKCDVELPVYRSHLRQNSAAVGAALLVGMNDGL